MTKLINILRVIWISGVFALAVSPLFAQSSETTLKSVVTAISKGDAAALGKNFQESVEITLPGSDATFSAQQAQFVLKDFFGKYPVSSFKLIHEGTSGTTFYATGTYQSAKGNFDVNIFLKKTGENYALTQLRFEEE